jgi:hypothetical protein
MELKIDVPEWVLDNLARHTAQAWEASQKLSAIVLDAADIPNDYPNGQYHVP